MPLLVRNLTLDLDEPEQALLQRTARRLKVPPDQIAVYAIVRRSIDARRGRVQIVYNLQLALRDGPKRERRLVAGLARTDISLLEPRPSPPITIGSEPLPHPPVIIGFGPAGMFAALRLAEHGYQPVVLERGPDVVRRHRDVLRDYYHYRRFSPESNVLFGEGGAGTYSDGKLATRINDPRCQQVLEVLFRHGAPPQILTDGRPHIGSDKLPAICRRIRQRIESLGGNVLFHHRVCSFVLRDQTLMAVQLADGQRIQAGPTILAIGQSARDTYGQLHQAGVALAAKPFQMGLRIEHPQDLVNRWQYDRLCEHPKLPPAEYQLVAKGAANGQDVFSFCMCPGGTVLPAHEAPDGLAVNGASNARRRGPFANAALVVTLRPDEFGNDPLAGLALQQRFEQRAFVLGGADYRIPAQRPADFLTGRNSDGQLATSYPLGAHWADLHQVVPDRVSHALATALQMFESRFPGFAGPDALLLGPETRASSPVRILRDPKTRQSLTAANLYPVGEGAGYAGGIVSAAVDGLKTAEAIIARYHPPR